MQIDLHKGDCLELMKDIPGSSVDLVLTDPPYGTMGGVKRNGSLIERNRSHERIDDMRRWDANPLSADDIMKTAKRLLRPNGKALFFSQEPLTSELVLGSVPSLSFAQRLTWKKDVAGNFLCASQNCMQYIEDICLFRRDYAVYDEQGENPLRKYFLEELLKTGLTVPQINKKIGTKSMANHYFTNGMQFAIPSKKHYEELQKTGFFKREYADIKAEFDSFQKKLLNEKNIKYPSVFNLNGEKSKSNVFEYKKDRNGYHPTQKPVALLEDLIQTYSNKGDTVLDFTMGSGSTGVACVNTGRNFIGIELDEQYFNIAQERIRAAQSAKEG